MAKPLENGEKDVLLFDPSILTSLDYSQSVGSYKDGVSAQHPGEGLIIRPLALGDFHSGYLNLLRQLTNVGDVSLEQFEDRFQQMKACPDSYYIVVIEDTTVGQIIGSATLVREQKFIHQATARARVEDVVVSDRYRGKQLGKVLVDVLVLLSKKIGCYKVSLECKDAMVKFYTMFGFSHDEGQNYLQQRFFD